MNWEWLGNKALAHGVFPLLYKSLMQAAADAIPAGTLSVWRRIFYQNAATNLYLAHALGEVTGLLERHGIRAIPYKGPALAASVYGTLTLRWAGDLDLLVHPQDYKGAEKLLVNHGYRARHGQWHESEFTHPTKPISFDIHRSATPRRYQFTLLFDDLWQRRTTLLLAPKKFIPTLCSDDLLVILSLELIKEFAQPTMLRLIRIVDIFETCRAFLRQNPVYYIDPQLYDRFYPVLSCACMAASRMYDVNLLPEIQEQQDRPQRLLDLVDKTISFCLLESPQRPSSYFYQMNTILLMHNRLHIKAEVIVADRDASLADQGRMTLRAKGDDAVAEGFRRENGPFPQAVGLSTRLLLHLFFERRYCRGG
jgi:hypothetical protein